ncbi:hypothetical protein ABEX25_18200 [Paenibacillus thiaminolyticus]
MAGMRATRQAAFIIIEFQRIGIQVMAGILHATPRRFLPLK